jgi:FixJ family two-component response regulator
MSTRDVPTVFIVDDDSDVRESLQELLDSVGLPSKSFGTAQEFLSNARGKNDDDGPSCLILDVRLPGISGLDLQHELKKAKVSIPIIFLTAHADVAMSVKAMKSGAVEFLTKPFRNQDLVDAVQQALARDEAASQERSDIAVLQERFSRLTAREREVMGLIVSGIHTKKVGSLLGMSEVTVAVHRGRLMRKMRASSLAELGRIAEKLKLPQAEYV